ncbi:MAG TPA: hypothetical protein VHS09_06215, partial [Polyangiaceae bacterium]|nr:hypothetical protein [Polyangiaceae bacterium]
HYLGQPGATAAVCDRKSDGPRFRGSGADDLADLTGGLVGGDVKPELWQRCAMILLESSTPDDASSLLDAMAHAYRKLLGRGSLETDPLEQAKVAALHGAFLLRRRGTAPHAAAIDADVTKLRDALAKGTLGPVATKYGREVLTTIDLERGLWNGAPLTVPVLDALEKEKDEAQLRRIALRVPDESLEREARRRIVHLHIAASPSPDVKQHASDVEAAVMATGRNAIAPARHALTAAWLDEQRVKVRGVLVRQDLWKQTATLLALDGDKPGSSVLPSLDLRGALYARADGLKDPVTLCAPPETLDVAPCLLPAEVKPRVPIVFVDAEGLLHFVERVTSKDAMRLVYDTPNLPLPFDVGGRPLLTIEWPIVFEPPDPLVFEGPSSGRGPDIRVVVERRYSPRILFEVTSPQGKLVGVVEARDAASFAIASRGGRGTPGARGMDGSSGASGSPGMPGSCPGSPGGQGGSGSPGGNGTSGGPGGPGGPGGNVAVSVACATGECGSLLGLAQKVIRSEGGAGGAGGEGGHGGTGGAGGPGG